MWIRLVTSLTACRSAGEAAIETLTNLSSARSTDFHYYYAAPFIFLGATVSPEEVICGNGFEVNRFPFYDVRCPCGGISDLNAFEIRRISNGKEIEYYGCVLAPQSSRVPLE